MAVTESTEASSSAIADDWETGEVQQEEQLKSKQQQIRLLKREKENREAAQREHLALPMGAAAPAIAAAPSDAKPIPVAPRKLLRRPASGPNMPAAAAAATVSCDVSPTTEPKADEAEAGAEIPLEEEEKFKNLEKRKAVYDATRARILGTDYKPEEVKAPVSTSCRSRSPEIELKARAAMGGGAGGPPPQPLGGPPVPPLSMMPPVNFSEPPPPLPPAHVMAAYQAHLMMAQQQQQPYYAQQYALQQMQQQQAAAAAAAAAQAAPTTSANQGYRDLFDAPATLYSMPPPTTPGAAGQMPRPQPLASMSLLASALPPPPTVGSNGMMYATPPPSAIGGYGRPPPSMFPCAQNPDITFRHVESTSSRGGRRRKN